MPELLNLSAALEALSPEEGTATVRLAPFGETIQHLLPTGIADVRFEKGSITWNGPVPVNIDHGEGVLDQIGLITAFMETDEAAYATLKFSDTAAGRDTLTLLRDGVITDVSAGVLYDLTTFNESDGVLKGDLDHAGIIRRGAFGQASNPSKVLAVHNAHNQGGSPVSDHDQTPTDQGAPENPAADEPDQGVAEFAALEGEVANLRRTVAELSLPGAVREPDKPGPAQLGTFVKALMTNDADTLAQFALAQDGTSSAAGAVPDYLSSEVISVIDTDRPFTASFPKNPIGDHGMDVVYPKVTQKPSVAKKAEFAEPGTQQMTVGTDSHTLESFTGANNVSIQLVQRSQPSFLNMLYREFASEYAQATEAEAIADAKTAITQTQVLADVSTSLSATIAALATAGTTVITGIRKPPDSVWVGTTRWEEFLSLVDGDGRPAMTFPESQAVNALGTAGLGQMRGKLAGLDIILCPDATATDMIVGSTRAAAYHEDATQELRALQVSTTSYELGVYGLFNFATLYPAGFVEFTTS